jgi:hypothetical protein
LGATCCEASALDCPVQGVIVSGRVGVRWSGPRVSGGLGMGGCGESGGGMSMVDDAEQEPGKRHEQQYCGDASRCRTSSGENRELA